MSAPTLKPDPVWFCVIRIDDFRTIYHGRSELAANACHVDASTVLAKADTMGDAERFASIAAAQAKTFLAKQRPRLGPG